MRLPCARRRAARLAGRPQPGEQPDGLPGVRQRLVRDRARPSLLSPAADAIQVALEAPDGTMVDGSSGAQVVTTEGYQTLRVALDPTVVATPAGTWIAQPAQASDAS
jgi:hypothetical protein